MFAKYYDQLHKTEIRWGVKIMERKHRLQCYFNSSQSMWRTVDQAVVGLEGLNVG